MFAHVFEPWGMLAKRYPHVRVVFRRLRGRDGLTNGRTIIWLDPHTFQVERRCALTHEIIHLERGEGSSCPSAVERAVSAATARRLISLPHLIDAHRWAMSLDEMADELNVTLAVLLDRLDNLRPTEAQALADAVLGRDDGA